jgi:hypothetical protein
MDASGQLHAPAAFYPMKQTTVPIEEEVGHIIRTRNVIMDLILMCSVLFLIPNMFHNYGDVLHSYVVISVPVACTDRGWRT